jgi:hypothetical protein
MTRKQMLKLLEKGKDPLDISIMKWEDVVAGKGPASGSMNCACCEANEKDCYSCVIGRYAEKRYDKGGGCYRITEFMDWCQHFINCKYCAENEARGKPYCSEGIVAAHRFLDVLKKIKRGER